MVFSNLGHLWRGHDIRLSIVGRGYTALRPVLLCCSETWLLRKEDMRKPLICEPRFLGSIGRICQETSVNNMEVRHEVLGLGIWTLDERLRQKMLRWLGHALYMPKARFPDSLCISFGDR